MGERYTIFLLEFGGGGGGRYKIFLLEYGGRGGGGGGREGVLYQALIRTWYLPVG